MFQALLTPRPPTVQGPLLERKFTGLVAPVLGAARAAALQRLLTDLPALAAITDLTRATVPGQEVTR